LLSVLAVIVSGAWLMTPVVLLTVLTA